MIRDDRPTRLARLAELAARARPAKRRDDFGSTEVLPPDDDLLEQGWRRTPTGSGLVPPARFNRWLGDR